MLGYIIGTEIITLLECTLLHYWKLITLSGFITVSMDSSAYFYYIIGVNTLSGIYYIIRLYKASLSAPFLRFSAMEKLCMSYTWYPRISQICWFEKTCLDWAEITGSGLKSKWSYTLAGFQSAQNRCPQRAFHPLIADDKPFLTNYTQINLKSYLRHLWWA